jgi:hypothetical protein
LLDVIGEWFRGIEIILLANLTYFSRSDQLENDAECISFWEDPSWSKLFVNEVGIFGENDVFHLNEFEFKFVNKRTVRSDPKN